MNLPARVRFVGDDRTYCFVMKKRSYSQLARRHSLNSWYPKSRLQYLSRRREVVQLADRPQPHKIVKRGFGLGEIVSRVPYCFRFGFDSNGLVSDAHELHSAVCPFVGAELPNGGTDRRKVGDACGDEVVSTRGRQAPQWTELTEPVRHLAHAVLQKPSIVDTNGPGRPWNARPHSSAEFCSLGAVLESLPSMYWACTVHGVALGPQ